VNLGVQGKGSKIGKRATGRSAVSKGSQPSEKQPTKTGVDGSPNVLGSRNCKQISFLDTSEQLDITL
jgi:hypothetical protein